MQVQVQEEEKEGLGLRAGKRNMKCAAKRGGATVFGDCESYEKQ